MARAAEHYRAVRRNQVRETLRKVRSGQRATFREVFAEAQAHWGRAKGDKAPVAYYIGFTPRGKAWDRSAIGKREVGRHTP